MGKLTLKQEAVCQAYIECGGNQSEAYRRAYNTEKMMPKTVWEKASVLFSDSKVSARVMELQAVHAERHNVTVDSITVELDENRALAIEEKQSAAATSATMGKAKIHGLITDKQEVKGNFRVDVPKVDADTL